ncbi:MAG: hypothetical protein KAH17_02575 [Bacteroidales bacterium]|nr:hypothetical protein [Bacteroidales bacterium]
MKNTGKAGLMVGVLATILFACSPDYNIEDPSEAPFHENGEGIVGTLGGVVMVGDQDSPIYGASCIMEAGAVDAPERIKITEATNVVIPGDPSATVVKFEPDGLYFEKPIIIGLPYDPATADDAGILFYDPESNSVTEMPVVETDLANGLVFVATDHFSYYFALRQRAQLQQMMYYKALQDKKTGGIVRTIEIGEQIWMADNLNFAVTEFPGSYIYKDKKVNANIYGRLYAFGEGEWTICPEGFHVPDRNEWSILIEEVGESYSAHYLKSKKYWNGVNTYGFNALPGGYYETNGGFSRLGSQGYYWTSELDYHEPEFAYAANFTNDEVEFVSVNKFDYISIRCIQGERQGGGGGEHETVLDTRDGRLYDVVKIGADWWFAQNLNYSYSGEELYRSDDPQGAEYGLLYRWDYAAFLCPDGWHLPTDVEWGELEVSLGMNQSEVNRNVHSETGDVAKKLKATGTYWPYGSATDQVGFKALPTGHANAYANHSSDIVDMGISTHFWTATESETYDEYYYYRGIYKSHDGVDRTPGYRSLQKSVRCVKDRN